MSDNLQFILITCLITYAILAMTHLVVQFAFAHTHHRRSRARKHEMKALAIVPVYNEEPERLRLCLEALAQQKYPNLHVAVVDDGSPNLKELEPLYKEYAKHPHFTVHRLSKNQGKRRAQHYAWLKHRAEKYEVYVTVDSDTAIDEMSMYHLMAGFTDDKVGAVTGFVSVYNRNINWLTYLIHLRYWYAFHVERAAQSLFKVVTCCSGPLAAYRADVTDKLFDKYVSQRFLGKECTYGDDRHLTNLILEAGYKAVYEPHAQAETHVPETVPQYLKQQIRWNKSFYREMLWTFKFTHRHHMYMIYDLTMQAILPFLLIVCLWATVLFAMHGNERIILWYFVTLVGIGLVRSGYGAIRTQNWRFLRFAFYGVFHVSILIPLRLYALASLFLARSTSWGTR